MIPTDQNGSGVANSNREYFDAYGNLTWKMDERGFMTRMAYDIPTGAMTQQIQDVDTSLYPDAPAGWATPSGGGLNLITDFDFDDQGRITQSLGPSHTIDLNGTATVIRTASWTVYDDVSHVIYSGQGYAAGTTPDYEYALVNPVSITKMDAGGRVNEQIQAAAASTAGSLAEIIDAAGGAELAFPQSSYTRWTTIQYTDCCLVASQRVYHTIPTTGEGASGTNYDETDFGYDVMKRRNRTVTPGGTITDLVFEPRGLVVGAYVGTNDDGATEDDPTGGGSDPANNMVIVTGNEYDDGLDGGDGNLTEVTQYVDASTARVTAMTYDFRDRNVTTDGEVDYFQKLHYDNLNRLIKTERYDTTESGNLIARSETRFDAIGRVYQSVVYGVDPATGTVGNCLVDNTWYDPSSNVIKSLPSGSDLFVKTAYDSLGRQTTQYQGYDLDESLYVDAFTVTDDVIMQQTTTVYDANSNTIQATSRQRYHNAPDTQTGALQDPSTTPKARVTYAAMYYDGIGRLVATANYGTDGGTALTRPSTVPTSSDEILVSLTAYDSAGTVLDTTDPAGTVTRTLYDDVGRTIETIENYKSISSSSSSSSSAGGCSSSEDTNRTTLFTYTPDGQQATMTAINSSTGDQTTAWSYGTTLENSDVATSLLLHSVTYPGSVSGSDVISYTSNRQGQRTSLTDQRGCVHEYEFDLLGRPIHDRVTTLGSGVDDSVLRLTSAYDVRGLFATMTSWNNPTVGSGSAVNEVQWTYNSFRQSIKTYQSHSGQVNTLTTANVQMSYADGSANTIRPMTLVYPDGRVLAYGYGTSGSITDAASQVTSLVDSDVGATHLADYSYLGLGSVVQQDSPEASLRYTLISLTGTNDPDTGDIYAGLDRFGRVKDCRWRNTFLNTDLSRVQYGYNRNSSRTWRANPTDPAQHYDWSYGYDGLQRVKYGDRGTLNGAKTEVTDQQFAQCWTLDSTGNWQGFRQDDNGDGVWDLVQSRAANPVNEITDIINSLGSAWVNPEYDAAGNMFTVPQPADPTKGFTAVYDAWNRLVSLTDGTSHETVQQNAYDGRNYRVVRKDYVGGSLSETRNFYYTDGWRNIEERLGTSPDSADADRQFVWGMRYIDDLVCRDRSVSSILDERLYASQDANWNVTAIIDINGSVEERLEYDPYGVTTFLSPTFIPRNGSEVDWNIGFAGYCFDSVTALYAIRHRFYSPRLGTWLSRDPIHSSLNVYAMDVSLNGVDPAGLESVDDKVNATWSMQYLQWAIKESQDNPATMLYGKNNVLFQVGVGFFSLVDTVPVAIKEGAKANRQQMIEQATCSDDPIFQASMRYVGVPLSAAGEFTAQAANMYATSAIVAPVALAPGIKQIASNPYTGGVVSFFSTAATVGNTVDKFSQGDFTASDFYFLSASVNNAVYAYDGVLAGHAAQQFALRVPKNGGTHGAATAIRWPDGKITPGFSTRCGDLRGPVSAKVQEIYDSVPVWARRRSGHGKCGEADAMSRRGNLPIRGGCSVSVDRESGNFKPACPSCFNALRLQGISTPNDLLPITSIQLLHGVSDFFQP